MMLSPHFSRAELIHSDVAIRHGWHNEPNAQSEENLGVLAHCGLEAARERVGYPLIITSGYRSKQLNKAVGGSPTSQHMVGQAADFVVAGFDAYTVFKWLRLNVEYDQLILEYNQWIHFSYCTDNRSQALISRCVNGKTVYELVLRGETLPSTLVP